MEIVLIILTSAIIGAFFVGFFFLGYFFGRNNTENSKDGLKITEKNKDFITDMALWRSFNGNNSWKDMV